MSHRRPKNRGRNELACFQLPYGYLQPDDRRKVRQRYTERSHAYDPSVFEQPDWTLYTGYFQSEKYFADFADEIRRELRFVPEIEAAADKYVQRLRRRYPERSLVALHVRRGDYLAPWAVNRFRVMPPEYFQAGAAMLPPGERVYVVFSDDIRWCRKNIRFRGWKMEFCQTESHWQDLAVLSRCEHFIISPSTFSWWGAWLATHRQKVVVTPRPWFGPEMPLDCGDLIPERWLQLAC